MTNSAVTNSAARAGGPGGPAWPCRAAARGSSPRPAGCRWTRFSWTWRTRSRRPGKADARAAVGQALREGGWGTAIRAVRVNDVTTGWAHRDVIEVVERAGDALDVIVLPKVAGPEHVTWLDLLLGQVERDLGYPAGRIGIEAQIEDARGLAEVDRIAAASPRLEALVFGPADFMASLGMRSLDDRRPARRVRGRRRVPLPAAAHPGRRPGSRPAGHRRAVRGHPATPTGCARRRRAWPRSATTASGCCIPARSTSSTPRSRPVQADYDRAELILDAYEYHTTVAGRGAAMLDGEMIDEASRKLALVAAARGRAAGLRRTTSFEPPAG